MSYMHLLVRRLTPGFISNTFINLYSGIGAWLSILRAGVGTNISPKNASFAEILPLGPEGLTNGALL